MKLWSWEHAMARAGERTYVTGYRYRVQGYRRDGGWQYYAVPVITREGATVPVRTGGAR